MKHRSFFSLTAVLILLSVISGQGCTRGPSQEATDAAKRVTLNVWAVVDDVDVYQKIFSDYRALHPYVSINYRRLRLEEYENELLNAMAEDRGPDIFLIHNTWVTKYLPKVEPMPASTKVAVQQVTGTLKKETIYVLETQPSITLRKYKNDYPDAVKRDTVRTVDVSTVADKRELAERIVAVPMSVDTLGMFANKDLLNAAGVSVIPNNWADFQTAVGKLTKQDSQGNIVQSGAALGSAYNVERAPDIIAALMMQNGAEMSDAVGQPTFQLLPMALRDVREQPPSFQAVGFYTDFANPAKEVYSWNSRMPNSLEAFIQGRTAFFFGYSYHLPVIRAQAPKLNLGVANLPQIEGNPTVNFANYWAWTVSKKSTHKDLSWNLLNFMIQPAESTKYLTAAKRPAAVKALLSDQLEDEEVGVFASQVLTAQSWYLGADPGAMEDALLSMVDNVLRGIEDIPEAVRNASDKVAQTVRITY
jgi:ABC-type glycerol-3-phosphate transport system substrate-binding protein